MSGSKNYGTFTQWNSTQQRERRSLYPLQWHGWNWRALCFLLFKHFQGEKDLSYLMSHVSDDWPCLGYMSIIEPITMDRKMGSDWPISAGFYLCIGEDRGGSVLTPRLSKSTWSQKEVPPGKEAVHKQNHPFFHKYNSINVPA